MRITTNLIFDRNQLAISDSQGRLSDIQTQLATGRRILRPSDDPVGSVQVIRLTEELDKINQFRRNIDLATNNLELQETTLRTINEVVDRARVLALQSGNGIISVEDRVAIGSEIEQLRNQVIDLFNTQNAGGDFIFAGFQSDTRAFEFEPANAVNPVRFVGDDGTNEIQISDSVRIQTTTSGRSLFNSAFARLDLNVTGTTGLTLESREILSQSDFDAFHRANFDAGNPANNQFQLQLLAGNQAQVVNLGNGSIVDTVSFQADEPINFAGVSFNLQGNPGDSLTFELPRPRTTNYAETLHNFSLALNDPNISDGDFQRAISDAVVGLDNSTTNLARENSSIGSRLNIAESVLGSLLDNQVANERARGAIQDVDFAEASSDFARQETALNAAFASFPRIANLSLFDFI